MPNVLIGPSPLRHQPGPFRDLLVASGFTPIDPEGNNTLNEAQIHRYLPEADAMLAGGESLSASLLANAPRLRVIARTGVGYDAVDLPTAHAQGIVVTITPGVNHGSVAEQTFALLLALSRQVIPNDREIREGGWSRALVRPIRESTFGILGLGRIGRAVATRARAFEMTVIAHDDQPPGAFEQEHGIERASLESVLARSDILSLHLPLTPETQGLIRRDTLAKMKPGAILLNTARGGLVVERDLRDALASGHLAGAGLDVLQNEPPMPGNPLLDLPNVVFSPHIGGIDARAMADMALMAADGIVSLYQGRWPEGRVVNEELRPQWAWNRS